MFTAVPRPFPPSRESFLEMSLLSLPPLGLGAGSGRSPAPRGASPAPARRSPPRAGPGLAAARAERSGPAARSRSPPAPLPLCNEGSRGALRGAAGVSRPSASRLRGKLFNKATCFTSPGKETSCKFYA